MIDMAAIVLVWGYVLVFLYLTARTARQSGKPIWLFSAGRERQTVAAGLFRASFVLGCILAVFTKWVETNPQGHEHISRLDFGQMTASAGLMVMALGVALAIYAQNHMGNSWRIGAAEGQLGEIVSDGPFAYSRNPVFVGQIALFAGLAAVYPTLPQIAIAVSVIVAATLQVRTEERVLERDLGAAYAAYRRRVRRWL